ncbi:MAG TPA: FAD-dependent oxidoreductase [Terricaulis sp.]|nr:FAD-dependent oxidoreductase [Terricaulis sp.]
MNYTRRSILAATAALPAIACAPPTNARSYDSIVIGAGVFGAWTAEHLRRAGQRVLLVDKMGPANARASSGGESRMTRGSYGRDALYTRMALDSLREWKRLSERSALPLFHQHGVLFFFGQMVDYARDSIAVHEELNLPLEVLDNAALSTRWPQIDFAGASVGLFEAEFGALMARRAVQELVRMYVARGGDYLEAHAEPGAAAENGADVLLNGARYHAEHIVYACGPWLGKVFPEIMSERLFVTRQEIAFIAPPDGDARFDAAALPGWADFNGGDLYYGFPNLEGRGFKIARDTHGAPFDPDSGDRRMSEEGMALLRAFVARRFPALAEQPFSEFRVCQYENTSNGDFLIDRHPEQRALILVGGGSGHGFKHGPEVGRMAAELALGRIEAADPRFSLASKATVHRREVL